MNFYNYTDDIIFLYSYTFVNTPVEDLVRLGPRETAAQFILNNVYDIY